MGTLVANFNLAIVESAPTSLLATELASMAPGDSKTWIGATETVSSNADYAWQSRGFYCPIYDRIHLLFKEAGGAVGNWDHRYYDLSTDTWTTVSGFQSLRGGANGHIYDEIAYDPATGDLYMHGYSEIIEKYTASTGTWARWATNWFPDLSLQIPNGSAIVPNLEGDGEAWLVSASSQRGAAIRLSDQTTRGSLAFNATSLYYGNREGTGHYSANLNRAIVGRARNIRYTPGSGTFASEDVGAPPMGNTAGTAIDQTNWGVVHDHPRDATKAIWMRRSDNGGGPDVWETTDLDTWTDAGYNHPFSQSTGWITVEIPTSIGGGGFIGFRGPNSSPRALLWVPAG